MLKLGSWGHSVLQTPALVSTSFFAKCLHVGEDGPGRGHLCHIDTFLVSSVSSVSSLLFIIRPFEKRDLLCYGVWRPSVNFFVSG